MFVYKEKPKGMEEMCKIMEELRDESYTKGYTNGEFKTTVKYYKRGTISIEQAAADVGMTVGEFEKKMNALCDTPTRVLANGRGFLRHGRTPQRTITSPLHPVTSLPLSRLFCGFLF